MTPLKLLLSTFARDSWGTQITAAVPDAELSFITAEDAVARMGPCDADIAFMTREVTGRWSRTTTAGADGLPDRPAPRATPAMAAHPPAGAERPIYVSCAAGASR